jgi:hypothetical protein
MAGIENLIRRKLGRRRGLRARRRGGLRHRRAKGKNEQARNQTGNACDDSHGSPQNTALA